MASLVHRLGRDTMFYGLARILSRFASVLLLPVYTRYLAPADYGLLQLLELAVEVTTIIFVAGTRSGMLRFYYRSDSDEERRKVVGTTFRMEVSRAAAGAAALALCAPLVWRYALDGEGSATMVRMTALSFVLAVSHDSALGLMQARQKAALHSTVLACKLMLQICFNLLLLVHLELGVYGMLWSNLIVNAIISVVLVTWLGRTNGFGYDGQIGRALRKFGAPYQLTMAGGFVLTFGDRYFLQHFKDATAVGLYAFAYQFGFLVIELGPSPFLRAWIPERYQGLKAPAAQRDRDTSQGFLFYNLILLTVATGIVVGAKPAVRLLADPAYQSAALLVPLVVVAYVFHAWTEATKFGIDASGRTVYYTYASWTATAVVLVGYMLLIPAFGGYGAALATLLAFAVRFTLTLHWGARFTPLHYDWPRILRIVAAALMTGGLAIGLMPTGLVPQLLLGAGLMAGYSLALWLLVLSREQREALLVMLRKARVTLGLSPS